MCKEDVVIAALNATCSRIDVAEHFLFDVKQQFLTHPILNYSGKSTTPSYGVDNCGIPDIILNISILYSV